MRLGLIWAQSRSRPGRPAIIGRDGGIPWRLPEDLARFRTLTIGHPVIMGRATWDSLPARARPLPERENLVLTRDRSWASPGARVLHSAEEARAAVAGKAAWVIGGRQVYRAFAAAGDRFEITEVDTDLGEPQPSDVPVWGWTHTGTPTRSSTPWQVSVTGLRYRFVTIDWSVSRPA